MMEKLDASEAAARFNAAQSENEMLRAEVKRLRAALKEIADMDFRGNRSPEGVIAYRALEK